MCCCYVVSIISIASVDTATVLYKDRDLKAVLSYALVDISKCVLDQCQDRPGASWLMSHGCTLCDWYSIIR